VKKLVDDVIFSEKGNEVMLVKYLDHADDKADTPKENKPGQEST
jgi:hypothetical protein